MTTEQAAQVITFLSDVVPSMLVLAFGFVGIALGRLVGAVR